MTIDEMIEVLQAYKEGKEIEVYNFNTNEWEQTKNPRWTFGVSKYRIKKNPTNLEIANKVMKETFGVDDLYDDETCPLIYIRTYDREAHCSANNCRTCKKWWNEEYKGAVNND